MDLGLGVKVLSSLYPSRDDGENDGGVGFSKNGGVSHSAFAGDQGRGRLPVYPSVENSQSHSQCADVSSRCNFTDSECRIRRRPSCELSFAECHFAETECIEDGGRLFKSLELGNGTSDNFESGIDSWYHHSMNDIASLNSQRGKAIQTVSNGTTTAKDSTTTTLSSIKHVNDDEDEIETMKNLFLSAWTNTKNGYHYLLLLCMKTVLDIGYTKSNYFLVYTL